MNTFPKWVIEARNRLGPWLAELMEPGEPYGRFRPAAACYAGWNLAHSTYAIQLHLYLRLLSLDDAKRRSWWGLFASHQDAATGCFHDPGLEALLPQRSDHGRDALWNHRRYMTKLAATAMLQLGHRPLYPITTEQLGFDPREETIEDHLAGFDWTHNPWGAGSASAGTLAILDAEARSGQSDRIALLERGIRWIEAQQDPQSGLWGCPSAPLIQRLNATMKVVTRLYNTFRRPLCRADRIIDCVLTQLNTPTPPDDATDRSACDEMNRVYLAAVALRFTDHRKAQTQAAAMFRVESLRDFVRADGAFSLYPNGSIPALNGIPISDGRDQGDIHGVCLIGNALALIADILGTQDELGWTYHGFHYGDWLTVAGEYEPPWEVVDASTYHG